MLDRFRAWCGALHGGQLVMMLSGTLVFSWLLLFPALLAFNAGADAREARDSLSEGDYCCDSTLMAARGIRFRWNEPPSPLYLEYANETIEVLLQESQGISDFALIERITSRMPVSQDYRRTRQELSESAGSGFAPTILGAALLAATIGLIVTAFLALWWWFGGRRSTPLTRVPPIPQRDAKPEHEGG